MIYSKRVRNEELTALKVQCNCVANAIVRNDIYDSSYNCDRNRNVQLDGLAIELLVLQKRVGEMLQKINTEISNK